MLLARKSPDFIPTLFNELFDFDLNKSANLSMGAIPQMNIKENENEYKLELSVPGLTKEDLCVTVDEEDNLVIEMKKNSENEEKDKQSHYLRHEFSSSQFKETMVLPDNIRKDEINAKVENGILNIYLPKINEREIKKIAQQIAIQ